MECAVEEEQLGFLHTVGAFSIESSQHHQVSSVCHGALVQVVLLHLQPVTFPWFIVALRSTETFNDHTLKTAFVTNLYLNSFCLLTTLTEEQDSLFFYV